LTVRRFPITNQELSMKLRIALAVALAGLLLPGAAVGQDTFTIKLKKSGKGVVTIHDRVDNSVEHIKVLDLQGNVLMEENKKKIGTFIYTAEILEQEQGKRPAKIKRVYEKAVGSENGKERKLGFQGQTVLIERKNGDYWFRYTNGNELPLEDSLWLSKDFEKQKDNNEDDVFEKILLPKKAVAAGEEWKLPLDVIAKEFNKEDKIEFDAAKATGFGKLHKVTKRDGRLFGDLEFRIELPVKGLKEGNQVFPVKDACSLIIAVRVETCIDGSVDDTSGTLSFRLQGAVYVPDAANPKAIVEINVDHQQKEKMHEVSK
jgi:hypothetical protein